MVTLVLVVALALLAFAYVALPLVFPGQSDPLPDDRDPLLVDLQEERDALFKAIRELDGRIDMAAQRREELRTRYEAKAARTLAAIDERRLALEGRPATGRAVTRRVPVAALAVLALVVATAAVMPSFVLPRVGQEATVTTTDVATATQLRDLQRAVQDDPSADNLLALGDFYLALQRRDEASAAYQRVVDTIDPVPPGAYQRLAVLSFGSDLKRAQSYLELARQAEPDDPDTLFLLSEVAYANGDLDLALESLRSFLAVAPTEPDPTVLARLTLLEQATTLQRAAAADPSEANLMDLADLFWSAGDRQSAVNVYFGILTGPNPLNPVALARTGEAMLAAGSTADGVALLERALGAAGSLEALEPAAVLALGTGYFALGQYQQAGDTLATYVALVGEAAAGNATQLIESARALAAGLPDPHASSAQVSGQLVFAANCATCHGTGGTGGSGPALAGSSRAANEANVADAVRFGRGLMPGFAAVLTEDELAAVVTYVTQVVAVTP